MEPPSDLHKIYEKYAFLLTEEKLPERNDILLHELGYLIKNLENFLSSSSNATYNKSNILPKFTEVVVSFGLVKEFQNADDRAFGPEDFPFEARDAEECFEYLNCLLLHYKDIDTSGKRKFLVQALLLCATHNSKYLWSSEKSVGLCHDFLKDLLEYSNYKSLSMLLCDDTFHPTIFKGLLKWLRPSLLKDTWMKTPSSCYAFYWLLSYVKHPHLIDYLYAILPPSFMFANYYAIPQKVLGIQCFYHILDNVPPSLIKADGIEDAIYDTLQKYIYLKEPPIVEVLYPCLLKLPMMNLEKANQMKWLQFDTVLHQLLISAEMEMNPKNRHLFFTQIYLFIKVTPCFKHLKKSLNVFLDNFTANSVVEAECRVITLKIVKELIRSCWPRMEHHCLNIMHAILKTIYDLEHPSCTLSKDISKETQTLCEDCLHLLKLSCPEKFKSLVNEYTEGDLMPGADLLISIA